MTPTEIIAVVRPLIQDTNAARYRYSDDLLLSFTNQIIKRMVPFRPDLFLSVETVSINAGVIDQTLPADSVRLAEIYGVVGGDAVTEVNRETLDQMYPAWRSEAAGTPVNWMRHPRNPNNYMLYPRPSSGVQLTAEYVKVPADYAAGDDIVVPDAYKPIIVDGVVFMAESIDAEHVGNGRAKFFYDSFIEALGADFNQRAVVDSESGQVGQSARRSRPQGGQQDGQ